MCGMAGARRWRREEEGWAEREKRDERDARQQLVRDVVSQDLQALGRGVAAAAALQRGKQPHAVVAEEAVGERGGAEREARGHCCGSKREATRPDFSRELAVISTISHPGSSVTSCSARFPLGEHHEAASGSIAVVDQRRSMMRGVPRRLSKHRSTAYASICSRRYGRRNTVLYTRSLRRQDRQTDRQGGGHCGVGNIWSLPAPLFRGPKRRRREEEAAQARASCSCPVCASGRTSG